MTRFVILAVPRTGSNLLCTLLNSHPQILCHHEVFNPQGVFTALNHRKTGRELGSLDERDRDPVRFLDRVWQTGTGYSCVGFKWTRGQNENVLQNVLGDSRVKKIVLRRRNRIKTYVSERIAQETQQWEAYSECELAGPRHRITVDVAELLKHVAGNRQFYNELLAELKQRNQPQIEVEYETLFDRTVQRRMLEHLNVVLDEPPLTAASVKQNPTDLRDIIANFEQLIPRLPDGDLVAELHDRGM